MTDLRPPEEQPTDADVQKTETVMPLVWGGLGLALVVGFLAVLVVGPKSATPSHPVVAPAEVTGKP